PVFGRSGYPSSCLTSRRSASISCAPYISPEASPAEIKILTWALYRDQSRGCSSLPLVLSLSKGGFRRLGILTLIGSGPSQRLLNLDLIDLIHKLAGLLPRGEGNSADIPPIAFER